jgi:hypothetical protein
VNPQNLIERKKARRPRHERKVAGAIGDQSPPDEKTLLDNRKSLKQFIRKRRSAGRVAFIAPITLKSPENVGSI